MTATTAPVAAQLAAPPDQLSARTAPAPTGGVALAAIGVGFAAATLSLANAHVVDPATGGLFTPSPSA